MHSPQTPQTSMNTSLNDCSTKSPSEDTATGSPMHYRAMSIYPAPVYMYHTGTTGTTGGSLLPTPPQQPYDLSGKFRDYSKSGNLVNSPYNKSGASSSLHQSAYVKQFNGPPLQAPPPHAMVTPPHKYPGSRLSHQQYGKRPPPPGGQSHLASPAYYYPHKSTQRPGQHPPFLSPYTNHHMANLQKGLPLRSSSGTYEYTNSHKSIGSNHPATSSDNHSTSGHRQTNRKSGASHVHSSRPTSSSASSSSNTETSNPSKSNSSNTAKSAENAGQNTETVSSSTTTTNTSSSSSATNVSLDSETTKNTTTLPSTTTTSHTPMTRPLPNLSPSSNPNQVQFFNLTGQRYNPSSSSTGSGLSQQQQQRNTSTRYPMINSRGGKTSSIMRQANSGSGKYKMNGMVQTSGKLPVDDVSLGGAGDAPPVTRLPMTPPATPQQTVSEQSQQLSETCHQMQALSL